MSFLLGFSLIAKLAGLGGTGALGIGARILGWDRKLVKVAKKVPPKGWLAIAGAIALVIGFFVHQHKAHAAIAAAKLEQKQADDAVFAKERQQLKAQAEQARKRAEQLQATITKEIRTKHDEEDRHTTADADALRVRGPGAARCGSVYYPGVPAGAGGHVAAGGPADDSLHRLPYPDTAALIGMPFHGAVSFAEDHDLNRNEVLAWRAWYPRMVAAWSKLRSSTPAKH